MHHYGRLKALCLGMPADGEGWTIWKGSLCDNDAYCMSKCIRMQECICIGGRITTGALMLIQQAWANIICFFDIWNPHVSLWEGTSCVYWSVVVCSDRCWLCEACPRLVFTIEAYPPFVLHSPTLFSSSNQPKCDSITVTCHFLFISADDKAFTFQYSASDTGISNRSLTPLKDKC